jgi:hypothetical protein
MGLGVGGAPWRQKLTADTILEGLLALGHQDTQALLRKDFGERRTAEPAADRNTS